MGLTVQMPKLKPWQEDVFKDVTNEENEGKGYQFVVKAKRQVGKSKLAIACLLYYAFKTERSIGVVAEPTIKQCRRLWKEIIDCLGGDNSPAIKSSNQTLLTIEFINDSQITLMSAEQGNALRGAHVKRSLLVIDEGAFIDNEVYDILFPLVDATNSPILIISTPVFKSGTFWERYTATDSHTLTYDWSKYDTSCFLSKEKLEFYRQTVSPLKFKSEYLGEFIDEGSFVFGDISKCYGELSREVPMYAGIDWGAGNDGDYTVLTMMDEQARLTDIKFWKNFDAVDLVEELSRVLGSHPSLRTCQVEMNSIGKVYKDLLKRKCRQGLLREFVTTNDTKRRIVEQLISAFQTGQITIPQDKELVKEIQHYQIERTPGGKITYNAMNGVHDDAVISLALCYDLQKRNAGGNKPRFKVL